MKKCPFTDSQVINLPERGFPLTVVPGTMLSAQSKKSSLPEHSTQVTEVLRARHIRENIGQGSRRTTTENSESDDERCRNARLETKCLISDYLPSMRLASLTIRRFTRSEMRL